MFTMLKYHVNSRYFKEYHGISSIRGSRPYYDPGTVQRHELVSEGCMSDLEPPAPDYSRVVHVESGGGDQRRLAEQKSSVRSHPPGHRNPAHTERPRGWKRRRDARVPQKKTKRWT